MIINLSPLIKTAAEMPLFFALRSGPLPGQDLFSGLIPQRSHRLIDRDFIVEFFQRLLEAHTAGITVKPGIDPDALREEAVGAADMNGDVWDFLVKSLFASVADFHGILV